MQQFGEVFGSMLEISKESNANRFGPLALNEWMRSAQAGTFLRVLGIGDADGRITDATNKVTGAGFVVGNKVSHDSSNNLQDNPSAVIDSANVVGATKAGRTHLLGCFMKDAAGSTFLQDAGLTVASTVAATATLAVSDGDAAHGLTAGQKLTLTSTAGTIVDYFVSDSSDGGPGQTAVVEDGDLLKTTGDIRASLSSGAKGIVIAFNLSDNTVIQNDVLAFLK
jgi:hypothetical protein